MQSRLPTTGVLNGETSGSALGNALGGAQGNRDAFGVAPRVLDREIGAPRSASKIAQCGA